MHFAGRVCSDGLSVGNCVCSVFHGLDHRGLDCNCENLQTVTETQAQCKKKSNDVTNVTDTYCRKLPESVVGICSCPHIGGNYLCDCDDPNESVEGLSAAAAVGEESDEGLSAAAVGEGSPESEPTHEGGGASVHVAVGVTV